MKEEPHSLFRHAEHPAPTVIHNPDEKDTVLGTWVRHALAKGPIFWAVVGGMVAASIAAVVVANTFFAGGSPSEKAWMELALARTATQQAKVAEDHPHTEAARWALLEAAGSVYEDGLKQLSISRDVASPFLKRSFDLFSEVYEDSAKTDPKVARLAALGMARALEASGDVKRAVAQYKLVAANWPATDEAKQAERFAKLLSNKLAEEFYAWLATYKPQEVKLPPLGQGTFDLGNPMFPSGAGLPAGMGAGGGMLPDLPENVFQSSPTPAPAAAQPSSAPTSPGAPEPASKEATPKP
jgi:hypothetical protein